MYITYEGDSIVGVVFCSEDCGANVLRLGNAIDSSYKIRFSATQDEFLL